MRAVRRVLPLSPHAERRAAGDQHSERGDRCQEIRDQRRRVQDLLEIVEHQQCRRDRRTRHVRAPRQIERGDVRQPKASAIADATSAASRMAANGDEQHAGCALVRDRACELQRQTGLPDPAWPDERDEARGGIGEPAAAAFSRLSRGREGRSEAGAARRGSVRRPPWREQGPARSPGARHGSDRSGRAPRTAHARSRRGAAVVPRAPARSRHEPRGPRSSPAPPA